MNLPEKWNSYIKELNKWKLEGFEKKVNQYKDKIPAGSKEPLRLTDTMAGVEIPLKLSHQQLARQFYEGTNCLLKSRVSIIACYQRNDNRVVIETFPDLVVQRFAVHNVGSKAKNVDAENLHREIIR